MQFIQQFLSYTLGLGVFHAVDHPVPHCLDGSETNSLFEPIDQDIRCRPVIGGFDGATALLILSEVVESQISAGQADAVNLPV